MVDDIWAALPEFAAESGDLSMKSTRNDLTVLIDNLKAPHNVVRIHAARILGTLGKKAIAAVPALIELLQAESGDDRTLAALTLGEIGPAAEAALPALFLALDDEDEAVAEMAEWALAEIEASDRNEAA
jgi:HEAT repeat protein